jgi:hypothetical protein
MRGDFPRDRLLGLVQPREWSRFSVKGKTRATRRRVTPFVVLTKSPLDKNLLPIEHDAGEGSASLPYGLE